MTTPRTIRAELLQLIRKETEFLRHYIGEISDIEDPLKLGRVKVMIVERGWDTDDLAIWCYPRFINSLSIPNKGDWVEVYFIDGDSTRPVWVGIAHEMADMIVKNYDGNTDTHILFEDPKDESNYIKYDASGKQLDLLTDGNKITMIEGDEPFVLGDTLKTELDKDKDAMTELKTAMTTWVPAPNDGGAALKTALATFLTKVMADYSSILSEDIKGK